MIILITGASYTGKTFLAQQMLEEYNYYINGFAQYGEPVMLIDTDYEDTIKSIMENN